MKWRDALTGAAVVAIVAPAPAAFAAERQDEAREIAQELQEHADPKVRIAAILTLGETADRAGRRELEAKKAAEAEREKLAVGLALMLANERSATSYSADILKESATTYALVREMVYGLPEATQTKLLEAALKGADAATRRDVFRYLAQQSGAIYNLLESPLTSTDGELRQDARVATVYTARPQALEFAQTMLRSRDAGVRADAMAISEAFLAKNDLRPELVTFLEGALGNRDEAVSLKAARQLVRLGEARGAAPLFKKAAGQEPSERAEILSFLVEERARVRLDELRPLIAATEDQSDRELLYQLAALTGDDAVYQELVEMFRSDVFERRLVGAKALGLTRRAEAMELLNRGLFEGSREIRLHSARGLGQIANAGALTPLRRAVTNERDKEVRLAAVEALGQIREARAVQVMRFLTTDQDPEIKLQLVDSLINTGVPEAAQTLEILLRDRDLSVQWQAFVGLLKLDPQAAERHVRTALRNPPPQFADALNPQQLSSAAREFIYTHLFRHNASRVREAAMAQLERYRETLLPLARELATADDIQPDVRSELIYQLAASNDPKMTATLESVVRLRPDEPAAILAAWALARRGDAELEASFRGYLTRDNPLMRAIASYGLARID
ncbi:hypothetical protein DL240_05690 [Lujinxingia litoralis]|uniref:HEAT repeat domain-containing protein n=1 Tax=Lujinxingia litoralis TaxID=2211119 RepID=A0A328CCM8_9DELT|nr:HEAT repeat domain-containing protein [Lujinxingia litoralis]RAL23651.1 hypothetical protein DL240_05690 [Lujinxingia litoralis]